LPTKFWGMHWMSLEENKTRWAVHFNLLKIYYEGKLVAEVDINEFPMLIVELAKALKEHSR
jgi:hypothetical protein